MAIISNRLLCTFPNPPFRRRVLLRSLLYLYLCWKVLQSSEKVPEKMSKLSFPWMVSHQFTTTRLELSTLYSIVQLTWAVSNPSTGLISMVKAWPNTITIAAHDRAIVQRHISYFIRPQRTTLVNIQFDVSLMNSLWMLRARDNILLIKEKAARFVCSCRPSFHVPRRPRPV